MALVLALRVLDAAGGPAQGGGALPPRLALGGQARGHFIELGGQAGLAGAFELLGHRHEALGEDGVELDLVQAHRQAEPFVRS